MRKAAWIVAVVALALLVGGTAFADRVPGADQGGSPLSANLTGAAEVPNPGDPDGSGTAQLTLNVGQGQICFDVAVSDVQLPVTMAHIHEAPAGSSGPVRVFLLPAGVSDADGMFSGCTSASREQIKEILQNPEQYYVNVHNGEYPGGAVRGQLSK